MKILGTLSGTKGSIQTSKPFARCYAELNAWLLEGKIKPWVDDVVGFDELPTALKRLADRQTKGRLVFDPRR